MTIAAHAPSVGHRNALHCDGSAAVTRSLLGYGPLAGALYLAPA